MMILELCYRPEGRLLLTSENAARCTDLAALRAAMERRLVLEGVCIRCDPSHAMIVKLGSFTGHIPREEGAVGIAEGITRDVALLARVGQPVAAVVTGIQPDGTLLLSRRLAQEMAWEELARRLRPGDILPATVTHLERFGAFVDIGCGLPSLLGLETLSVSRIRHPGERFALGQEIFAVVTGIDRQARRVSLSHKELLGTWQDNADQFSPGMTVPGIVRGVKDYGAFVELTANLSGLAENRPELSEGERVSVLIKSIFPERMKLKLAVVRSLGPAQGPTPLCYYQTEGHVSRWQYAPPGCGKVGPVSVFTD